MINSISATGVTLMLETAPLSGDLMRQKQKQTKIHCIPALEVMNFLFFSILWILIQPYFLQTLIPICHFTVLFTWPCQILSSCLSNPPTG